MRFDLVREIRGYGKPTGPQQYPFNSSVSHLKIFHFDHLPVKACIPGFMSVNALFTLFIGRVKQRSTAFWPSSFNQGTQECVCVCGGGRGVSFC